MPRLTDPWFEASFIFGVAPDGQSFSRGRLTLDADVQGVRLWCPCGYGKPEFPAGGPRPHAILVPFAGRGLPDAFGPRDRSGNRPRWQVSGTSLENLTVSPSVDVGSPSCWHGHIQGGEVR